MLLPGHLVLRSGFLHFHFLLLYHHLGPDGFTAIRRSEPYKPMITWLFAIWGTQFLFAGVMSLLVGKIFFKEK